MERLYLDTNVLFPMTLMDLLLAMAEDFHHDILWSDFLPDEWERVIVRERHRTPEPSQCDHRRHPASLSCRADRTRRLRGDDRDGARSRSR